MRRGAAKAEAAAEDEYGRLVARSKQERYNGSPKAAAKIAKAAIKLDPRRPDAYGSLGATYISSGEDLRAADCFLSSMERAEIRRALDTHEGDAW